MPARVDPTLSAYLLRPWPLTVHLSAASIVLFDNGMGNKSSTTSSATFAGATRRAPSRPRLPLLSVGLPLSSPGAGLTDTGNSVGDGSAPRSLGAPSSSRVALSCPAWSPRDPLRPGGRLLGTSPRACSCRLPTCRVVRCRRSGDKLPCASLREGRCGRGDAARIGERAFACCESRAIVCSSAFIRWSSASILLLLP
jgi:hypothetical protein